MDFSDVMKLAATLNAHLINRIFDRKPKNPRFLIYKMELEVKHLKKELNSARENLKSLSRRYLDLKKEFNFVVISHKSEKQLRDEQLSKIIRTLILFEARLRNEQKSIQEQLAEKDTTIRKQQLEITRLRRCCVKIKRTKILNYKAENNDNEEKERENVNLENAGASRLNDITHGNSTQKLKRQVISKINLYDHESHQNDCRVRKTDSFAGSDVSKESLGSENTDASILTTTTEGSPSLLSTEGFCEGESTDVSPGSTLNKCCRRNNSDGEQETSRNNIEHLGSQLMMDNYSKRRMGVIRLEPLEIFDNQVGKMSRSDSKDDGMDCNFVSEEEEDAEPIYVNSCNENNVRNAKKCETRIVDENKYNNNNRPAKLEPQQKSPEETSGNWYSDPDEDRISEEVFRHNTYRPSSNHNSVLECVNQILLRDMEEEEKVPSVSRKFKHRGRIVSFQAARLSDIESVGSEMERRNAEETSGDRETINSEAATSEDEFGMRLSQSESSRLVCGDVDAESVVEDDIQEISSARAIPIVIIEPDIDEDITSNGIPSSPNSSIKSRSSNRSSPILRLKRTEEKTCLISPEQLTIAKNLDYEDIESLPEIVSPTPKTPPALPPKPQFKNNTLILKKIPSPSFLIDETRKKHSTPVTDPSNYVKKFGKVNTPVRPTGTSVRSLTFKDKSSTKNNNNGNFKDIKSKSLLDIGNKNIIGPHSPRVTNIVRHFEEFKIGGDVNHRSRPKDRKSLPEVDEIDIRQNFEEFNLDECDLTDDPDRPEGDGSDRLTNTINNRDNNDLSVLDNKNGNYASGNGNGNGNGIYDHFLEATGLSTKSILTPSRLLSNHKSMLKPKDIKYKSKIRSTAGMEKHGHHSTNGSPQTHVKHWTGPFV